MRLHPMHLAIGGILRWIFRLRKNTMENYVMNSNPCRHSV